MRSSITPLINRVGIIRHIRLANNSIPTSMNTCAAATRFRSFYHTSSAGLSVFDFPGAVPVPESRPVRIRGLSTAAAAVEVEQPRRRRTLKTKDPIVVVSIYIYIFIYLFCIRKDACDGTTCGIVLYIFDDPFILLTFTFSFWFYLFVHFNYTKNLLPSRHEWIIL